MRKGMDHMKGTFEGPLIIGVNGKPLVRSLLPSCSPVLNQFQRVSYLTSLNFTLSLYQIISGELSHLDDVMAAT